MHDWYMAVFYNFIIINDISGLNPQELPKKGYEENFVNRFTGQIMNDMPARREDAT